MTRLTDDEKRLLAACGHGAVIYGSDVALAFKLVAAGMCRTLFQGRTYVIVMTTQVGWDYLFSTTWTGRWGSRPFDFVPFAKVARGKP